MPQSVQDLFNAADSFVQGYIEAALWTGIESYYDGTPADLTIETYLSMVGDCAKFLAAAQPWLDACTLPERSVYVPYEYDLMAYAGHDFFLTRNRHGSGFWDGDWQEPYATQLTDLAHSMGEVELFRNEDGTIST